MLRPKKRTVQNDCSGSSIGSADTGGFDSSSVCYDAMSPSNVTVSLQPKSPRPPASRRAGDSQATTAQSLGSASVGSPSLGSISTVVSQTPSLAESIGSFDADKMQTEERKTLAGSGLLSGDMSAAFPESIERAEEVLRYARETLERADSHTVAGSLGGRGDEGGGKLTTEELEELSRALKRALFVCPNHKGLHAMRGEVHRRLQDFRTAVGSLRLAVRMDKSALNVRQRLAEALLSQGMVWLDGGDHEAALVCFEEACTVDGANASVHFYKTVALVKLARFGEALRAMESVLGRRKGTGDDYVLRAKIRWALGMVAPGNNDMDTARALQSDHPEVVMFGRRCLGDAAGLYAKAKALADAGNDQMAVKVLNQVAELTPDDVKVPFVRAACKRRLKDFVGALRDYDECSFRHFEGVHVGRRALNQAADRLRNLREVGGIESSEIREVAAAAAAAAAAVGEQRRGGGGGGGGKAEGYIVVSSATGEDREGAGDAETSNNSYGSTHVVAGGGDVERAREHGGNDNDKDVVDDSAAPDGEVAGWHTAPGQGQEAERAEGTWDGDGAAGRGGAVLASRSTLPIRVVTPKGVSSVGGHKGGATGTTAARGVVDTRKIEETVEAQAVNERLAEAELHLRFRLAIPHAGPDPKYTLQPSSRFTQQGARQEQQAFSLLSPPSSSTSSQFSGNVSLNANVPQEEEAEGEGYAEPAYITRQRCLVLNDWGLSLFESGEYTKAVLALNLAIEGDKAFARVTGGAMESKFFLNRGDCYRASEAAEMAVRDYKRALEVEPGNWMVKTRLSLAHYLKGNSLFNDGGFPEAKGELDIAIAYNWKVSAYYLLRGHAQYFGGWISNAHADYRRALQLDPGNAEARRLCRQFDSKGKLATAFRGGSGRDDKNNTESQLLGASASSGMGLRHHESALPLPLLPSPSPQQPPSSSRSVAAPPYRPSRDPKLQASVSPINSYSSSAGTSCEGGACSSWKQKWPRPVRRRRRVGKLSLPVVNTRPPKQPEWRESAISWVKASDDGVRRVFNERFGGVPARDERLWGMLKPCVKKGWSAVGAGAGAGVGAGTTAAAAKTSLGGSGSVSSSGKALGPRRPMLSSEERGNNGGSGGVVRV